MANSFSSDIQQVHANPVLATRSGLVARILAAGDVPDDYYMMLSMMQSELEFAEWANSTPDATIREIYDEWCPKEAR